MDQISPKRYFRSKTEKSEHQHWIMHIQIGLGTKFPLKLTIFILKTRFAQKGVYWSKTEKVNTTYSLHNSAYSNRSSAKFQLKLTILIFWTKYAKTEKVNNNKWKQKEHHHGIHAYLNSAYLNWSWYKISAQTDNFEFLDQIYPKKVFPVENRTNSARTTSVCFLRCKRLFKCRF